MKLMQKFYGLVIDATDAFGNLGSGVDVRTYREQTYGHPDGVAAARAEGVNVPAVTRKVAAGASAVQTGLPQVDLNSENPVIRAAALQSMTDPLGPIRNDPTSGLL